MAGVLRVLGGLLLTLGLLAAEALVIIVVMYVILVAFRYVSQTGKHRNEPLDLKDRERRK